MKREQSAALINTVIIILSGVFLFWLNNFAVGQRMIPPSNNGPEIYRVQKQRDAYAALKFSNVWGAHLVHLNRFFNMVEYFPKDESISSPFPIHTKDIVPYYEKAVGSHNWLFIATRTGLVRRVTSVLPNGLYRTRAAKLKEDRSFRIGQDGINAYSYDISWTIVTLGHMAKTSEPVVVIVDAGYFSEGADPREVAALLRTACPDIRIIVFVESLDESDVTAPMREALLTLGSAWEGAR